MKAIKILLVIGSLIFLNNCFSQKQDFVWYLGSNHPSGGLNSHFFHFSDTGHHYQSVQPGPTNGARDGGGKSVMADKDGNLLFYTDGFDIFNKEHQIMEGGDKIFLNSSFKNEVYYIFTGNRTPGSTIILETPESEDLFYVIYHNLEWDTEHPVFPISSGIYYSKVDMTLNGGLGAVAEKNVEIVQNDFKPHSLVPIRHANGRDWWLVLKAYNKPEYHLYLVQPSGISFQNTIFLPSVIDFYTVRMFFDYRTNQLIYFGLVGIYPTPQVPPSEYNHRLMFFDFDRCTGDLENYRDWEFETSNFPVSPPNITYCSNGRFVYTTDGTGQYIFQISFDNESSSARLDTIADKVDFTYIRSGFWSFKISPSGELWVQNWSDTVLTIIGNPELPAPDVNIHPNPLILDIWSHDQFPNNANYRIGPIDGSPCDTLGINNEPKAWFRYNGINLENKERRFTDISYFRPEEWHWDFGDGTTFDGQHPGVHEFPAPGEYYVCLTVSNEYTQDTYCEWVVIDEISSIRDLAENSDFWVFPNPTTGDFTLRLDEAGPRVTDLRVYDLLGREMHRHRIPAGDTEVKLSLGQLPPGRYILQLHDGKRVRTGSVVVGR